MSYAGFALIVDPDRQAAADLAGLLFSEGIECAVVDSGDHAWQTLAARRPDLILMTLDAPAVERFHRRLRDEYLGKRPPLVGLVEGKLEPTVARLDLDAVVLRPLRSASLLSSLLCGSIAAASVESSGIWAQRIPTVSLDVDRMREMLKLTALGGDLQVTLDSLATRIALIYGLSGCAVLASAGDRYWVGATGDPITPEAWPEVWNSCVQAVHAGAPLFVDVPGKRPPVAPARGPNRRWTGVETRLAVPIPSRGGAVVGAICLISDGPVLFTGEARDALSDLAGRLGNELSWRSVHQRMAAERDRLRETSMLDPMLGVLARSALEQAIAAELSRRDQSGDPLALAVIDITGLRHINHRYGHVAGDAALRHVANVTRRMVRGQDIVGRSGDDEIAVVFAATPLPAAAAILERIRRAIEAEPFEAEESGPLHARVGAGVTEFLGADDDGGLLVDRAARAASTAGRRGGPVVVADRTAPGVGARRNLLLDRYEAGVTLGGMYQIVHEISRGSMGVVYRAEDLGLGRPVAIKMLRPDLVRDLELVRRFREEAAILASINNENLVRVYSFVEEREDVFFVMELVEGVSLDHVIAELAQADRHLALERASAILTQVANALDAMHRAGVMHRDVKPGNVVLDRTRERAVLVDVGLARRLGDRAEPAGTPGFIAPESVLGHAESPATDVYGLAATAYALLTGQAPFGRADDYREILRRQLEDTPHPPSEWREDLPPAVDAVILRGLAVDGSERYPTAGDMALALAGALGAFGVPERSPILANARLIGSVELDRAMIDGPTHGGDTEPGLGLDPGSSPGSQRGPVAMTRGVVFRGVMGVLGLRAATAWMRTLERENQLLADALSLRTSPMSWLPAERFHDLLAAVAASGRSAQTFARELGAHVAGQSFQRFYSSSPESLTPGTTLSALDILWRRYHTWGALRLVEGDERAALVGYDGPNDPAICAFIEGWLEHVVGLSGGEISRVVHTRCLSLGDEVCEFSARWGRTRELD